MNITLPATKKGGAESLFVQIDGVWKQHVQYVTAKGTSVTQFRAISAHTLARIEGKLANVSVPKRKPTPKKAPVAAVAEAVAQESAHI